MTRKEWVKINYPEMVDEESFGGVVDCPHNYELTDSLPSYCPSRSDYMQGSFVCACDMCWNEEITNEVHKKEDKMTRADILHKAEECVCGHREQDYGSPESNFGTIGKLWSAYSGVEFSAKDVAMMMCLFKIARIMGDTATADSFIDLAGYAACGGEIAANTQEVCH